MGHAAAVLAGCDCLHFAVKRLVDDAVTRMLATTLRLLPIAVPFVKFLGQKLEKFMGILLLGRHKIFERLLF